MKNWNTLVLIAALMGPTAHALPVLNLNSGGAEAITVYPDHLNANLFYIAPTVMLVAHDENGTPQFSYIEDQRTFTKKALVQSTMIPAFNRTAVQEAKAAILARNPNARFTALPYVDSSIVFEDTLSSFIEKSSCSHPAGLVGDEQTCSFLLNNKGRKALRSMFRSGLTITMQLEYSIVGVTQNADQTYSNRTSTFRMAGRLGGGELARYPQLFRDHKGRIIGVDEENDG